MEHGRMINKHGLDTRQFQNWLNRINKEIDNLTPEQFKNELHRMIRDTPETKEKEI
jgi:hypothetical protein